MFFSLVVLAIVLCKAFATVPLWPLPSVYKFGTTTVTVDSSFQFTYSGKNEIISKAIERYSQLIKSSGSGTLKTCTVGVHDDVTIPSIVGADESNSINITSDATCSLTANNVWGALRVLETFSQLLTRSSSNSQVVLLENIPISIADVARYGHRGMLIDTARHYISLDEIKRIIDSFPMNKFNVFHWHMVDAESFPFNSVSEPTMIQGAFSPSMIYTMEDLKTIREYAYERGIELLVEVDVPGHAAGWLKGKPEIMADCLVKYDYNINNWALDPSLDLTYTTVNHILSDIITATGSKRIHLGGDEVVYGCWKNDSSVISFYNQMGYTSYDQVLGYFVNRIDSYVTQSLAADVTHWEEVFTAGVKVPANTIFQVWTDSSKVATITSAKYPVIASPSNYWYLNYLTISWQTMYAYDPTQGLTSSQASYIKGGECALWGEYVDDNNIESTLYPRACAVAERLWSPSTVIDTTDATNRLVIQRCRMNNRGFHTTPIKPADYCDKIYV